MYIKRLFIIAVKHPPIDFFAKQKKKCWKANDENFKNALSVFTDYTEAATTYYNGKKFNKNSKNVNNNVINRDSNKEIEKLLTHVSKKK